MDSRLVRRVRGAVLRGGGGVVVRGLDGRACRVGAVFGARELDAVDSVVGGFAVGGVFSFAVGDWGRVKGVVGEAALSRGEFVVVDGSGVEWSPEFGGAVVESAALGVCRVSVFRKIGERG